MAYPLTFAESGLTRVQQGGQSDGWRLIAESDGWGWSLEWSARYTLEAWKWKGKKIRLFPELLLGVDDKRECGYQRLVSIGYEAEFGNGLSWIFLYKVEKNIFPYCWYGNLTESKWLNTSTLFTGTWFVHSTYYLPWFEKNTRSDFLYPENKTCPSTSFHLMFVCLIF